MRHQCDRTADEIWERARAGEDLPPDIREHIAACPACERTANETQKLLSMVQVAACVPDAPDCRSAVMERVSAGPVPRSAWAYAIASVLLIAVILTGLLTMRSGGKHSTTQVVRHPTPRPEIEQRSVKPVTPEVRELQPTPTVEKQTVLVRKPEVRHPKRMNTTPKHAPVQLANHAPKQESAPQETPEIPAPVIDSYEDQPVAAVAVTWPSTDLHTAEDYSYVDNDVTTGEITTCRVQRSTNSVTIYYESKSPGNKPGKGA